MTDAFAMLERTRTMAVVGCSATPGKDAHEVPRYMLDHVELHPVNPHADEIFGRRAYRRLADVPGPVDLVNVFRPSAEAADVVRQAVEIGARDVWLQTGITSREARRVAESAGVGYVENACIRTVMHMLLHERRR